MEDSKLSPKQTEFVKLYLQSGNATYAYSTAYRVQDEATARAAGSRLLTNANIQRAVTAHRKQALVAAGVSLERVVLEIAKIAFATVKDVIEWQGDRVRIKPFGELSPSAASVISEFTETDTKHGTKRSIKLHNRLAALDLLMKHFGGYVNARDVAANLSPEQLQDLAATLLQKAQQSQTQENTQEDDE
jgi:phage terminase small subunit